MSSTLRAALRTQLTTAMRARDRPTAGALRSVLAALENAEAVPTIDELPAVTSEYVAGAAEGLRAGEAPRRLLTPDDERAVVQREVAELPVLVSSARRRWTARAQFELAGLATTVEQLLEGDL